MCIIEVKESNIRRDEQISTASSSAKQKEDTQETKKYSWKEPNASDDLTMKNHFSSLLFGGSVSTTALECLCLLIPFIATLFYDENLNVEGSMSFQHLSIFLLVCAFIRRIYNAYLEAVYFSFPELRTQPPSEHRLKQKKDLMGRDAEQLELLDKHDKWTIVSQFLLNFGLYYVLPGFYPQADEEGQTQSFQERFMRLLLNHYVLSFGMYWAHRR